MRYSLGVACLFCVLLLPAAGSARSRRSPPPKPLVIKEGKVQVVRGIRRRDAQLTDETGKRWVLVGPLREEFLRLHGHQLRVHGVMHVTKDPAKLARFSVTRYELMLLSGKQPQVGRLARRGAVLSLVQKERVLLMVVKRAMAARLEPVVGCKIWVLGDLEESTIKVFRYGRITCEKPSPIKAKKKEKSR